MPLLCQIPYVNIRCLLQWAKVRIIFLAKGGNYMLNHNLKTLRQRKGLSQEELAVRLHVVRQTVSKWEKGLSVPDAQMLLCIAEALDTTVNVLLGDSVEEAEQCALDAITARLELLNEQFVRYAERRRLLMRITCVSVAAISLAVLAAELIGVLYHHQANAALQESAAIIGGADQPTAILLTSAEMPAVQTVLLLLVFAAAFTGLVHTRRR